MCLFTYKYNIVTIRIQYKNSASSINSSFLFYSAGCSLLNIKNLCVREYWSEVRVIILSHCEVSTEKLFSAFNSRLRPTLIRSSHMTYRFLLEHYVSKPFEVRWFEGRKDKQRAFLVELLILKCSLWICDAHGGLRSHVLLITSHWSAVQPVAANYTATWYAGLENLTNTNILDTIIRLQNLDNINE